MRELTRPLPESNGGWLTEMAAAYLDAREAIPFGDLLGEPFREPELFHLASAVVVKFRGCSRSARRRKSADQAALASYAANLRANPGVLGDPYLAFAFCYLASHYGLRLLTAERVEELMAHTERNRNALARLIAGGTKSGTAGGPSRRRRPNRPRS